MKPWGETALRFGEILDITFRIIKEKFSKIFLILLIFYGPVIILQGILLYTSGYSFLGGSSKAENITSFFTNYNSQNYIGNYPLNSISSDNLAYYLIFSFLLALLMLFISTPVSKASTFLVVDRVRKGEEIELKSILKQTFSRYWPLIGGSVIYYLILFGMLLGLGFILPIVSIIAVIAGTMSLNPIITVLLTFLLMGGFFFLIIYFMIRWGFYFGGILTEKVSPGLEKSWKLTRGKFWRLFGLYIVLYVIAYIIVILLQIGIAYFFSNSVLAILLNGLTTMFSSMLLYTGYAVMFFDLRVRNEASDLEEMISNYPVN